MKRLRLLGMVLVVAAMLLSACTAAKSPVAPGATEVSVGAPTATAGSAAPTEVAPAEGPKRGGAVVMADMEPNTLNPYIASEAIARACIQLVQRGLVGVDPEGNYFPAMAAELPTAENGGISDGGKTISWKLRPGLKWSDGTPLTSEDIKFTWQAVSHPESTATQTMGFDQIEAIDTPDDVTAVVHYKTFYSAYMAQFALGLLPRTAGDPTKMGTWEWNRAVNPTNGPFVLTEWVASDHMVYERNPHWYEEGKPYLDRINYPIVPELETQRQMLLAGENDIHHWLDREYVEEMEKAGLSVQSSPAPYWMRIQYNLGAFGEEQPAPQGKPHPILGDVKVREALSYAFNASEITYNWLDPVFTSSMFFGMFNCEDQLQPRTYSPETTKAMLEEAGWTDTNGDGIRECHGCKYAAEGTPMRLMVSTYTGWGVEDNEVVVVDQLKKVGVDAYVQNCEATIFYGTYGEGSPTRRGEFDIAFWDYELGLDPGPKAEDFYASWRIPTKDNPGGCNLSRVNDEQIDEWIKIANGSPDPATRRDAYCNIAKKLNTELFSEVSIGVYSAPSATSKRVKGWRANESFMPYACFGWDTENWYIDE